MKSSGHYFFLNFPPVKAKRPWFYKKHKTFEPHVISLYLTKLRSFWGLNPRGESCLAVPPYENVSDVCICYTPFE